MQLSDIKRRLSSAISRLEPIINEMNAEAQSHRLLEQISMADDNSIGHAKESTIKFLTDVLTQLQIKFVEMEEPDNSDADLFKKYLYELKVHKQDLSTPNSEVMKQTHLLLRRSKSGILNNLSSQTILFTSEYLDTLLNGQELEQDTGAQWLVYKINEALNGLLSDINGQIEATFNSVCCLLGTEIDDLESNYTQRVDLNGSYSDSVSDSVFGMAREALPAIGIGGISTTLVTSLINPIAGVIIGFATGGLFLFKSHSVTAKRQKIATLKSQLAPKISLAMNEVRTFVMERFDEFDEALSQSINSMICIIDEEIQDCVDALKSCEQEAKEFHNRQEVINSHMNSIENQIKQVQLLLTNPFDN